MVTFYEYILIVGFRNGCFSIKPFPKDRRYFVLRELDKLEKGGLIREDRTSDFSMITTPCGDTIIKNATIRIGEVAAGCLIITDIEPTPFARHHLYPD